MTKKYFPVNTEHQSVEIPNSGGVRQSSLMPEGVTLESLFDDVKTAVEALQRGCRVSNNGPCLGWRDSDPKYKWLHYNEVLQRSKHISYGLIHAGMKQGQNTFIGIYAQNCVEWVLLEYACYFQSAVMVPLYDTLGPTACNFILNNVEAEFLICDSEKKVQTILDVKEDIPMLKHIIVIHEFHDELKEFASKKGVNLHRLEDIEDLGRKQPQSSLLPSPSDLATVCFTSGTTGNPKGVMLTHRGIVAESCAFIMNLGIDYLGVEDRTISYLPLSHMFERANQLVVFMKGGSVGFFRGDIKLLAEDMQSLKPTMIAVVPRVLNKIYDKIQNEVKLSPLKKLLLEAALRAKQSELQKGIIRKNSVWDRIVFRKIQDIFGGKIRLIVSGGAALRTDVFSFFKCSMGCVVVEGYGQTESTSGITCSAALDYNPGTVGPPLPCCFVKLADVLDMGYLTENGEGEILAKGPIVMKGYYKDPLRTAEVLDEDGWLHTGDIAKWTENGALRIIDRKKNLMKLSQGEYISPEKVEAVYQASDYVEQIFVHGDSIQSCLVAIVIPESISITSWCLEQGIKCPWEEICRNQLVKNIILMDIQELGKKAGLKGFEQVKAIYLHPDAFTEENGLLTATMKLKREECKRRFKDAVQNMYSYIQENCAH